MIDQDSCIVCVRRQARRKEGMPPGMSGSLSKEELITKLKEEALEYEGENSTDKSQYVDICEDTIIRVVEKVSGEKPHTIRYFTIPDVDAFNFTIGCVAKIDNNGTTYIFLNDHNVLENMNSDGFGEIKITLNEI